MVVTATAAGASLVADAASAASAAETAIEALLPSSLSLGISEFCVGFTDHTNCTKLPLNISDIIPEAVKQFSGDIQNLVTSQFQPLQYLEGVTAKVTSANIKGPIIVGIGFFAVLSTTLFFCRFIIRTATNGLLKVGIGLLAILCCIPFAIPPAILFYVESKIQESGPIISIEKGDAASLSIGALVCTIVIMLLTSVILVLYKRDLS